MSAVRAQQLPLSGENPVKSTAKSVEGQKTTRRALTDLSNALSSKAEVKTTSVKPIKSRKKKGSSVNAYKDIDFTAEKEYMPKSDISNNLAFDTDFIPSCYFNNLLSVIRSTPYPDVAVKQDPSLTLTTETSASNDNNITEEDHGLPSLDLPPLDMPDFP